MQASGRSIGLLGGSFDPPHEGHLWMARRVFEECGLDEIWLLPAVSPPHKGSGDLSAYEHRLAMTLLLAAEEPFLAVCRIEESLPLPGYSIRSIRALKERHPLDRFSFIIGGDSLAAVAGWKESEAIFRETDVIVLARPGFETETHLPCRILLGETHPAQSRRIRAGLAQGEEAEHLCASVRDYIREHGLYRNRGKA